MRLNGTLSLAGGGFVLILGIFLRLFSSFTGISTFGVTLGTSFLVLVISVMSGFEQDLKTKILGTNAHIVVKRKDEKPFPLTEKMLPQMRKVPGVIGATPYLESEVMLSGEGSLQGVLLK